MPITNIISGGQTGADRGGLEAAIYCDVPHGGWCPKGRKALDGVIPVKYQLKETESADYPVRTEANIVDSDATLVLCYGAPGRGSKLTVSLAKRHSRPCLAIDLTEARNNQARSVETIVSWLKTECPDHCTLNVAGSRESGNVGIQNHVTRLMVDVISKANGTLFYPPPDTDPSKLWVLREEFLAEWKVGQVVRLREPLGDIPEGFFIVVTIGKTITLCRAGEDENGDVCRTDDLVQIELDQKPYFGVTDINIDGDVS